jgi:hypothetical protein
LLPEPLAVRVLEALDRGGAINRSRPRRIWEDRFNPTKNHHELISTLLVNENGQG